MYYSRNKKTIVEHFIARNLENRILGEKDGKSYEIRNKIMRRLIVIKRNYLSEILRGKDILHQVIALLHLNNCYHIW